MEAIAFPKLRDNSPAPGGDIPEDVVELGLISQKNAIY
jgi:hypothetical protein